MTHNILSCIPGVGVANLNTYVAKSIEAICPLGYGKEGDAENHCAHFVSHALNIQVGSLCTDLLAYRSTSSSTRQGVRDNERAGMKGFRGGSIRVDDIYNSIVAESKGEFDARPPEIDECLIYATLPANIDSKRTRMGSMSRKHVGIHRAGSIWHYGNTEDRVACDGVAAFQDKFRKNYGRGTLFLWSAIPDVASACVHGGVLASLTPVSTLPVPKP
jgi:hypothetical protein